METKVGIRELKNQLSKYVRQVEAGDVVLVTDRGKIVAELRAPVAPPPRPDIHPGLLELNRKGLIRLATRPNDPSLYRRQRPIIRSGESIEEMMDAIRGE
jgi:antitoxin (DNA-binding transcriptional repressor) of toxin-antitoxin stability system